jgi:hypothetical protein
VQAAGVGECIRPRRAHPFVHSLRLIQSLEEIAADLNKKRIKAPHGTNRWIAASVRRALAS